MKVLAVAPSAASSGAERVLLRYLQHAADRGHDVLCLVPPGRFDDQLRAAGLATTALPALTVPAGRKVPGWLRLASRWLPAARRVRSAAQRADVVLVNGFLALPAVRLAHVRAPVVWLAHDVIVRQHWMAMLHACAPAVGTALCVSEAVAEPVAGAGIVTRVVRNGTSWPVPPATPDRGEIPVVGASAMLTSWKGQDVLLDAVAQLEIPVRVELMGGQFARDGAYAIRLARRAALPDLEGRVDILGHVEDPLARMRSWTIAVSSSVRPEATPLAVLEAMSLGLPVVGTNHGGTPEILDGAGLLVPPADPRAMSAALRQLLTDADLYRRCVAAGPAAVASGLRVEDGCERFLAELVAATQQHGRGSP